MKRTFHRRISCLFVLLCVLGPLSLPGALVDNDAAFTSLKEFLSTNWAEFEVTYSVLHQSNSVVQNDLDKFAKGLGLTGLRMILDRPIYYKVRVANDGYSVISANSLDALNDGGASAGQVHALGVTSNTLCWSENNNTVFYDYTKFGKESARLGPEWTRIGYEQAVKMLSLGLPVRKGSVIWSGTNFTAESTSGHNAMANEQRAKISGSLSFSNGMPYIISYQDSGLQHMNRFVYGSSPPGRFILPAKVVVSEEMKGESSYNVFEWVLIGFSCTNYPPNSTAPGAVLKPENMRAVVTINPDGVATLGTVAGKQLKRPLVTKMDGKVLAQETLRSKRIRAILIAAMLLTTAGLAAVLWRVRRSRREDLKEEHG